MELLHLIGRIVFGGFFIYSGINHFTNLESMKGYAASKGVGAPGLAVPLTGVLLVLGGLSVVLGLWPRIGLSMLIVFLVPTAIMMHDFWAVLEEQKQAEMINFSKDLALAAAALMMLAFSGDAWPFSLGG
ncbi:MAG TPA: DoxX family protein [Longimicrobiales bacterium]|nr:DoxX family protein [Longimicrobiales bacterium]